MPARTEISTRVLPAERFIVSIHGERSGRVLREVAVSESTASTICSMLDTGSSVVAAGADLVRAVSELGRVLEPLTSKPARKLPARGRR